MPGEKKRFIIHLREKHSKKRICIMMSHSVCFETFSVKHKENDLHWKYKLLGAPAENLSSTNSHLQSLGAECLRPHFLNYWKIDFRKIFLKNFSQILHFHAYFVMFCIFYLETDGKLKNLICMGLGHSIPNKTFISIM